MIILEIIRKIIKMVFINEENAADYENFNIYNDEENTDDCENFNIYNDEESFINSFGNISVVDNCNNININNKNNSTHRIIIIAEQGLI